MLEFDSTFTNSGSGTASVSSGATLVFAGGGATSATALTVASGGTVDITFGGFSLGPGRSADPWR